MGWRLTYTIYIKKLKTYFGLKIISHNLIKNIWSNKIIIIVTTFLGKQVLNY